MLVKLNSVMLFTIKNIGYKAFIRYSAGNYMNINAITRQRAEVSVVEKNIVVIGNGAAGHYAAETMRNKDAKCSITIVSDEKYISYYRPRLSHYLGEIEVGENFFLKELLDFQLKYYLYKLFQ